MQQVITTRSAAGDEERPRWPGHGSDADVREDSLAKGPVRVGPPSPTGDPRRPHGNDDFEVAP
jgi:hypothetical protein